MNESPVYIVIGATGGIGAAITKKLSQRGASLVLAARGIDRLRAMADETGGEPLAIDATKYDEVESVVRHATTSFGRLDGIVNCVGSILLKPAHLTSIEEYRHTVSLNLDTAFYTVKAASRAMFKRGGSIILCASAVARTGLANHEAIAAAKSGIVGLVQSAAATYAGRNIRVNCIAPGLVETPMSERLTATPETRKHSESMHALGRLGKPDDVAEAMDWLLDQNRSGWVTGQTIGVDGGLGTIRPR